MRTERWPSVSSDASVEPFGVLRRTYRRADVLLMVVTPVLLCGGAVIAACGSVVGIVGVVLTVVGLLAASTIQATRSSRLDEPRIAPFASGLAFAVGILAVQSAVIAWRDTPSEPRDYSYVFALVVLVLYGIYVVVLLRRHRWRSFRRALPQDVDGFLEPKERCAVMRYLCLVDVATGLGLVNHTGLTMLEVSRTVDELVDHGFATVLRGSFGVRVTATKAGLRATVAPPREETATTQAGTTPDR